MYDSKMCSYLLKYSKLKSGLRLAACVGDPNKAGRIRPALSGYGRPADEEVNKEGSIMTW